MEHKAGLRARFVRNSIGGGSHDPRNWIGCVSRREETTAAGRLLVARKEARKETILSEPIRIANPYWSTDNWIVPLADDQSPVGESGWIGKHRLPLSAVLFRPAVSPCYSLTRETSPTIRAIATPSIEIIWRIYQRDRILKCYSIIAL